MAASVAAELSTSSREQDKEPLVWLCGRGSLNLLDYHFREE